MHYLHKEQVVPFINSGYAVRVKVSPIYESYTGEVSVRKDTYSA